MKDGNREGGPVGESGSRQTQDNEEGATGGGFTLAVPGSRKRPAKGAVRQMTIWEAAGELPPNRGGTIHDESTLGGLFDG